MGSIGASLKNGREGERGIAGILSRIELTGRGKAGSEKPLSSKLYV
jgi:hypothetical protein